jgi:hypothetical protein
VPQPSAFEVEMATEKLKTHKYLKVLITFQQKLLKLELGHFVLRLINVILLEWGGNASAVEGDNHCTVYKKSDKTDCSNHQGA